MKLKFFTFSVIFSWLNTTVDDIFEPVTWHHQGRPLRPRLDLQNKKGLPRVGRRSLL
jgi:hypothetical protein